MMGLPTTTGAETRSVADGVLDAPFLACVSTSASTFYDPPVDATPNLTQALSRSSYNCVASNGLRAVYAEFRAGATMSCNTYVLQNGDGHIEYSDMQKSTIVLIPPSTTVQVFGQKISKVDGVVTGGPFQGANLIMLSLRASGDGAVGCLTGGSYTETTGMQVILVGLGLL
jgi:hypothetical protein